MRQEGGVLAVLSFGGFRVWGLGVWGLGVWGLGFRVWEFVGLVVSGLGWLGV